MRLIPRSIDIHLPWIGEVTMELSEEAASAAWALYLELATRISPTPPEKGPTAVREALESLARVFDITRMVLREIGIGVVRRAQGHESVGSISIRVLNEGLRPHLMRWHASFSAHESASWKSWLEAGKPIPSAPGVASCLVDESAWSGYATFFDELAVVQGDLQRYVAALEHFAGIREA